MKSLFFAIAYLRFQRGFFFNLLLKGGKMVSETRRLLEQQISKSCLSIKDENAGKNEEEDKERAVREDTSESFSEVKDDYADMPESYGKDFEKFYKTLSPEVRKYLHNHERLRGESLEQLRNKLQSFQWVEDVFNLRLERMLRRGIKSCREWIEMMAKVDDSLEQNPLQTLSLMAEVYGMFPVRDRENSFSFVPLYFHLQKQLHRLENDFSVFRNALAGRTAKNQAEELKAFREARTEAGDLKHPHFDQVCHVMQELIRNRFAVSLEDAYEKALWLDGNIRRELIRSRSEEMLKARTAEAQKAKQAAFSAGGKTAGFVEEPLTTRQMLEKQIYGF